MPSTTNPISSPENARTQVSFDLPLIKKTGGIGDVLVELMATQIRKIQIELQQEFKKEELPPKILEKILNSFVSLEGTKQPRRSEELLFPNISEKLVSAILKKLVDARLLRTSEDDVYELGHDTLAAHINQTRDHEDIVVDETVKMIKDAFYFQDKTNRYLLDTELVQFEKYATVIQATNRLTEEEWGFVQKSRKKEQRRTWAKLAVFFLVLGVAVFMSGLYTKNRFLLAANKITVQDLEENKERLEKNKELTQKTANALQSSQNDRTDAFKQLRNVQIATSDDGINQNLVEQLTENFLSEFSLFPFYNRGEQLSEAIDEAIVEDSLKFIMGAAMNSPAAFFKNLGLGAQQVKTSIREKGFLFHPNEFNTYGKIRDMTLLKDGRTIITAHINGNIWKWNVTSDEAPELVHHFDSTLLIREMALSGDQLLVSVDSIIYALDLRKKAPYARFLVGFNRPVKLLVTNPAVPGQYAVVKENSAFIYLCNSNRGGIDTLYHAGLSTVTSMAFSPNGRKMIAAYEEGEMAKLWDLKRPQIITEFKGHRALISAISFSPDGRQILTGSWDQTAILWTYKGEIIKRLVGHKQRINSVAYTKNHYAVTCSDDGDIKTWYLAPLAERELLFEDSIRALAVNAKNETIAFSLYGDKGFFYLWDWRKNTLDTIWQPLKKFDRKGDIVALAYTEDGQGIVAASENTLTTFIDLLGKQQAEDYRGGGYPRIPHTPSISAVDVNDHFVLIADRNTDQVVLRDRKNPGKFKVLPHPNQVLAAKFSPDDQYVLSGCEDGRGYLWDMSTDPPTYRLLQGHTSKIVAVDFSPDGQYLLTGSYDNTAHLYKLRDNHAGNLSPIFKLEGISDDYRGHTSDVNAVAFAHQSKDGIYRFITGSADKDGKYWELRKDGSLHELPSVIRHLDEVTVAGFLPGDSLVVTGSFDESIKVWKVKDVGKLIDRRVLGPYLQNYLCRFSSWTLEVC